jgi:isopentenyldiphosphate isomerase
MRKRSGFAQSMKKYIFVHSENEQQEQDQPKLVGRQKRCFGLEMIGRSVLAHLSMTMSTAWSHDYVMKRIGFPIRIGRSRWVWRLGKIPLLVILSDVMADIILVNEDDDIISYKERDSIDADDIYRISSLRLTNSSWEFLIAKRSMHKKNSPWKWWPAVAGTVEKWESYMDNIVKEIDEEIWLVLDIITLWPKRRKNTWWRNYFQQRFFSTQDISIEECTLQAEEVDAIKRIRRELFEKSYAENPENFLTTMPWYVAEFSSYRTST